MDWYLCNSTPDKEKALQEFKKAVDLDPLSYCHKLDTWPGIIISQVNMILLSVNLKKCASFISKAQQYIPVFSLGLIYLKQHLYPQAKEAFDKLPEGNGAQIDNSPDHAELWLCSNGRQR